MNIYSSNLSVFPFILEPVRHHGNKKQMIVHYSLWIGGDKNEIHTITLGLPKHSNFVEVMEAAEKMNPRYK